MNRKLGISLSQKISCRSKLFASRTLGACLKVCFSDSRPDHRDYALHDLNCRVFSFCGIRSYSEQVASLRSFLVYTGIPREFTVISDGTLSHELSSRIKRLHSCVRVINWTDFVSADLPLCVVQFASKHPLGKKFAVLASIHSKELAVYCDSDVLFFSGAKELRDLIADGLERPHYLLDSWPSLDKRLLPFGTIPSDSVNSGFLMMPRRLDWRFSFESLASLAGEPTYFTEQTLVHLAIHSSGGNPLPQDRYIMSTEDQFRIFDPYVCETTVLRHYTSSIRAKLWHDSSAFGRALAKAGNHLGRSRLIRERLSELEREFPRAFYLLRLENERLLAQYCDSLQSLPPAPTKRALTEGFVAFAREALNCENQRHVVILEAVEFELQRWRLSLTAQINLINGFWRPGEIPSEEVRSDETNKYYRLRPAVDVFSGEWEWSSSDRANWEANLNKTPGSYPVLMIANAFESRIEAIDTFTFLVLNVFRELKTLNTAFSDMLRSISLDSQMQSQQIRGLFFEQVAAACRDRILWLVSATTHQSVN